jgi:hypothetical protein
MADGNFSYGAAKIEEHEDKYAPGYESGIQDDTKDTNLTGTSYMRADQQKFERYMENRGNYFYGGTATGGADAAAAVRENVDPYSSQLYGNGNLYFGAGMNAAGREAPLATDYLNMDRSGQSGQYGAANEMTRLAAMGPGPSVAQANLQANSAAAMRQQLAMAGSGRGAGGSASAFRQAGMNQANIQGQANAQAAMLGAQETADWQAHQAGLLNSAGALYGQGRASDMAAAGYYSDTMMGQTGLNDQFQLGMAGASNEALNQGGNLQLGTEQGVNAVNMAALTGSMGYEQGLTDIYSINKGIGKAPEDNTWVNAGIQGASDAFTYLTNSDDDE